MKTTLDLALTRWAVVCHQWRENGGIHPQVGAFLSGWFLRDMSPKGCPPPNVASFRDSFRRGWQEASIEIAIIEAAVPVEKAKEPCPDCGGRGGHERSPAYGGIKLCHTCEGDGEVPKQNNQDEHRN